MGMTQYPLPPFSPAKDPADYPLFKGEISRWVWRTWTQRLTAPGRWFAAATIALLSYGGASSLTLQSFVPAVYVSCIWGIAFLLVIFRPPRVKLSANVGDRAGKGHEMHVDVQVQQLGRFSGGDLVVVPHDLPMAIDAVPEEGVPLPDMRRGESAKVRLGLRFNKRGKFIIKGFRVESGFPFGILRSRRTIREQHAVLVYPDFTPLVRLDLPSGRRYQPGGVAMASNLGESFEYLGNREYRQGDNVRDIDWKATARLQKPIVREWVEEYMLRVAVILDTHVPGSADAKATDAFEHAVSLAAAVSDFMARQDYLVDLFAAGPNLYHLTAGRSLAYLDQILDILACVESNPNEPFDLIEPQIAELLSRISTVICVFLDWNDARHAFVERMRMQGAAVKVIILRDGACTLPQPSDAEVIEAERFKAGISEV